MISCDNVPVNLRGAMVEKKTLDELVNKALTVTRGVDSLLKERGFDIETIIDILAVKFDISVHIASDSEWEKKTRWFKLGESTPLTKSITLPRRYWEKAKKKDTEGLHVFFHELGHVVLEHHPVYMKDAGYKVTVLDGAEEQADIFADICLAIYGFEQRVNYSARQLTLF